MVHMNVILLLQFLSVILTLKLTDFIIMSSLLKLEINIMLELLFILQHDFELSILDLLI